MLRDREDARGLSIEVRETWVWILVPLSSHVWFWKNGWISVLVCSSLSWGDEVIMPPWMIVLKTSREDLAQSRHSTDSGILLKMMFYRQWNNINNSGYEQWFSKCVWGPSGGPWEYYNNIKVLSAFYHSHFFTSM